MRYVIDAPAAIRIVREGTVISAEHQLVAPNLLRSDAMALLYAEARSGTIDDREGRRMLDAIATLRIRLLGDRVSRATAWRIAAELGLDDPAPAEYLAVGKLQADALVALDPRLAELADGVVPVASFEALIS